MHDLISRGAAIDADVLSGMKLKSVKPEFGIEASFYTAGWNDAIDAIIHLPSAQQWIPCKERLPDKLGTYICTCVENDINHVTFIKWQNSYKRWDLNGRRTFWRVTAWMPLPEPYQKEGD